MANKKIYKNRLSLPIFDNKGMGNGNGIAYVPNIIRGGSAIPIGNNMFFMKGKSHNQGGIDIGKDLEVERNEVVQNGKFGTRVFSSIPFLRGVSPAERVLQGENPDAVFAAQENWKRINKINDDGSRKARKGKYITNPNVVKSDNTRVAPILNNTPKSKETRQGDFIYTPKQLVADDEKGFAWQPASRRVSQVPLERTYPEFDALMLGRAIGTALSKDMQLRRAIDTSFENNKVINKNISPKVIKYSPKTNNENLKNIFDIKNDIDFYNAANEFANKYGYETFDKSLIDNRKALEDAVKQMLNRHNTFYRGVVGDDATKRIAIDTPWKEGEGIWITPQADYAQLYGQVGKLQRPYKLSSNRNNWFKDADFDYTFADDNVGLINPWQRNPKLYENTIIDKSVPHEIYAKDKLNFVDWIKDIKNAKGSNNIMNYKKFGGRIKSALGLSLFRPNSFRVQELPIDNFLANSINKEIETPEVPTYVLKDDEKPVGKKVNPNVIGGGRLYNGYAVDNHEKENINGIGGGRVYTAKPIDEFATDSVSFGDIKSPRGFREQDADYIYDYLSKHSDLTDTAKAAILATAAFESGMNHKARNKYSTAKGYFQWLNDRYVPTPGLSDEQEKIVQLNKIIDDMTPVKGKAKGWTQTKDRNIFDLANEFRTTDDIDRAVEIITRHHIRPSLGEEPRKNKQGIEVDKGYKWEIAERRKVAKQFYNRMFNRKNKKEFGGMKFKDRHKATWGDWIWNGLKAIAREARKPSYQRTAPSWINSNFNDVNLTTPRVTVQPQVVKDWDTGKYLHEANKLNSDVGREREIVQNYINDYRNKRRDVFLNDNIYGDNGSYDFHNKPFEFPNFKFERGYNIKNADIDNQVDDINEWNKDIIDFYDLRRKWHEERNNRRGSIIEQNDMRKYGGLSRSKDYGSKDKPYPSVNKNDFAGGGRSYPIPTRADAIDALRLAGLHHRSDVRAKVYAKYPDLRKKAAMGTIDEEDLQDLIYKQRMNSKQTNTTPESVRTNYVERNNSSNDLGKTIGQGVVGSLIGGSTIFGLNKLTKNYTPSLSKNNRFVSPNYDVVENPTNLERKYNYPKRVANRIKNSGVEDLWDKRRLEDATKRINSVLDRYGDKVKVVNEPVAKEISSTQVYDVAKSKKYTPNLSEFSPKVKAGVQQINKQNLNLARRLGTNIRNIGGILGKTLPGVALVDFVRNLFPSKQQEQEADKAWRRYKSPTGRIPEDYQMKFGGRKKALFGKDGQDILNETVWDRLSLTNPETYYISGKNGVLYFNPDYTYPIYDMYINPATRALVPSNKFSPAKFYEDLGETIPVENITLSNIARSVEPTLPNPSRSWIYNVPYYTGNINGQEVVINPAYMRQVPKSVRQAILNNTPEIVRGSNNTRRSVDVDNVLADSRPQFYAEENRNMYPETSRNYGFRYGWSHGATPNYGADIPASTAREANMIANIDLSKYFNSNGTPKPNPTRRTQPVSVRTERVGNIPGVYTENMKRPNLTQLGTQGIGLNMPAYENPFATRTSNYNIGLPMTLDTSRLDSTLSKYGVTPISSSTGNGINPADVEAVRSGNFKAIDNDRYVPIHTTTEDWVGLGANLLGSIGSYLGTRAMLNRYPMPSKPVPAIAQKLKTRFNINSALDQIREQAGSLGRMVDNNTDNSRVAQARKQGISNNATASANQQYNQKENIETQLINQDIMNRQRVGLYNNQVYNNWLSNRDAVRQYVANAKIGNFNNVLSGANQSIQDLLGRVESRDALGRNLIFMQAAYPNVNWRNIFQNNRELARSFGFRFLNN